MDQFRKIDFHRDLQPLLLVGHDTVSFFETIRREDHNFATAHNAWATMSAIINKHTNQGNRAAKSKSRKGKEGLYKPQLRLVEQATLMNGPSPVYASSSTEDHATLRHSSSGLGDGGCLKSAEEPVKVLGDTSTPGADALELTELNLGPSTQLFGDLLAMGGEDKVGKDVMGEMLGHED